MLFGNSVCFGLLHTGPLFWQLTAFNVVLLRVLTQSTHCRQERRISAQNLQKIVVT